MSIEEEKRIIYELMKELIGERRELSKQYYDLKARLIKLENKDVYTPKNADSNSKLDKERILYEEHIGNLSPTANYIPFDRISRNIVSILKQSAVPLSNKQIMYKLNNEYELSVSLKNLSCNILPKMINERSFQVERAYRGYWQYRPKV